MAAHPEVLAYLIEGAKRRGIDPNVVVKAFGHEGLNVFDPNKPDRGGDEGSSFGPYQLHYAGISKSMPNAGMGDDFTRKTGLDARDPSTWRQQTDFVLDHLASGGTWKPWMGAAAEGITGRMGLPGGYAAPTGAPTTAAAPPTGQTLDTVKPAYQPLAMGAEAMPYQGPTNSVRPPMQGPTNTPTNYQGPAAPAPVSGQTAIAEAEPSKWEQLRKKLAHAATGFKMPAVAKNDTNLAGLAMPAASRIDTPEIATFDQNQIAQQRQNLAMAMQRLNSGKIWL